MIDNDNSRQSTNVATSNFVQHGIKPSKVYLPHDKRFMDGGLLGFFAVHFAHIPIVEWQALADKQITGSSFCQGAAQKSAQTGEAPPPSDPQTAPCLILQAPLDGASEQPQQLLCTTARYNLSCRVFARDPQAQEPWQQVGEVRWPQATGQQHAQLVQALREGRVQVQASPWRDLAVPGLPAGRVQ